MRLFSQPAWSPFHHFEALKNQKKKLLRHIRVVLSCSGLLLAAVDALGAVGDDAQLISVTVPQSAQVMPRTIFTQTWTLKNIGTNTWSPGQSGYTLNIRSSDSLGATRVSPNGISSAYHPSATINSGQSVPPGGQATFSMSCVAPEASGSVTDLFQVNGASGAYFGPTVSVQVVVMPAGSTNQYDRAARCLLRQQLCGICLQRRLFLDEWIVDYFFFGAMAAVPKTPIGDDCAHFVSCCIGTGVGSQSRRRG